MVTAVDAAAWGMVGFAFAGGLHLGLRRSSTLPVETKRLAPPGMLELITAGLFSAFAWRTGVTLDLLAYSWLVASGVLLAAIDWNTRVLPTKLIWLSGAVLVGLFAAAAVAHGDGYPLIRSATGMAALLFFYGVLYFSAPGQLGGGDLRLGGVLGLALGWAGWSAIWMGTLFGSVAAAIALLVLRAARRPESDRLPQGPFLVLGTYIALLIQPAP